MKQMIHKNSEEHEKKNSCSYIHPAYNLVYCDFFCFFTILKYLQEQVFLCGLLR